MSLLDTPLRGLLGRAAGFDVAVEKHDTVTGFGELARPIDARRPRANDGD